MDHVKSISQQKDNGRVILMKAEEKWWSDSIRLLNGNTLTYPGARFYKARWWQ